MQGSKLLIIKLIKMSKRLTKQQLNTIKSYMVEYMRKKNIFVPYGVSGKTRLPRKESDIPNSMMSYKNKVYSCAYKKYWRENSISKSARPDYAKNRKNLIASIDKLKARTTRVEKPDTSQPVIITYSNGTVVNISPNGPITVNFKTT